MLSWATAYCVDALLPQVSSVKKMIHTHSVAILAQVRNALLNCNFLPVAGALSGVLVNCLSAHVRSSHGGPD